MKNYRTLQRKNYFKNILALHSFYEGHKLKKKVILVMFRQNKINKRIRRKLFQDYR